MPSNKVPPANSEHGRPQRGPDEKPILQGAKTTALDGVRREAGHAAGDVKQVDRNTSVQYQLQQFSHVKDVKGRVIERH